jgi:hypothetical protein
MVSDLAFCLGSKEACMHKLKRIGALALSLCAVTAYADDRTSTPTSGESCVADLVNWLSEHTTVHGDAAYSKAVTDCKGHTRTFGECVARSANECKQHTTTSWADCYEQALAGCH